MPNSGDLEPNEHPSGAHNTAAIRVHGPAVALRALAGPIILVLAGASLTSLTRNPQVALFGSWVLCAAAALSVVRAVPAALRNEVGRDDAAHLFTIAWFILLTSAMAAGSLWNVSLWTYKPDVPLDAFVSVPSSVWILGGITILSNVGVRAAFAVSQKADKYKVERSPNWMAELMTTPLDDDGSARMGAAQFVVFNVLGLIVYGVAVARIFGALPEGAPVPEFPEIPPEVLGLMAVSGGGIVASSAVPLLRR